MKIRNYAFWFRSAVEKGGNHLNVINEGNKINFVTQYNHLCTIIDNHLNLNENLNRSYKRASTRLRQLERLRPYLTVDATIKVYLSMIVPIMTYSSTIRILCNDTQCKKLESLDRRASFILKLNVTSIGSSLNHDISYNISYDIICMLVKRCLLNELNLETFNNYFEIFDHKINTRSNSNSIRLPLVKLELSRQGFFLPVAFFTTPYHWQADDILLFKGRLKERFK